MKAPDRAGIRFQGCLFAGGFLGRKRRSMTQRSADLQLLLLVNTHAHDQAHQEVDAYQQENLTHGTHRTARSEAGPAVTAAEYTMPNAAPARFFPKSRPPPP